MKRNYYYKISLSKDEDELVTKALAKAKKDKTATFIRDKALKAIRLGID